MQSTNESNANQNATNQSVTETSETPSIVDDQLSLLITVGAAVAGNGDHCLRWAIGKLNAAGAPAELIQAAIEVGQMVKSKPAGVMKEAADALTGTQLSQPEAGGCPVADMEPGETVRLTMLIAVGAAMAANCEPCLNQAVPFLIEDKVNDQDIRRAAEIGQRVKGETASLITQTADALVGSSGQAAGSEAACCADATASAAGCCC